MYYMKQQIYIYWDDYEKFWNFTCTWHFAYYDTSVVSYHGCVNLDRDSRNHSVGGWNFGNITEENLIDIENIIYTV